jgi:UDP-N-acetylmuramoyl-tripeptide--D-alanyl-D-alanine ligase
MKPILSLDRLRQWLPDADPYGDLSHPALRVHTDSRTVEVGDLFVALQGENFDGNQFLGQVAKGGAVAAICSAKTDLMESGLAGGLVVPDPQAALQICAARWREMFSIPIIAVTGSNGKTTVTQMIAGILRDAFGVGALSTAGNFNNHIGVPLTLLRLRAHHVAAVVEMGMNHPGEIRQLASWTQPTVALVNNAQREHQEFMETVEAVALENGAVLQRLAPGGAAVFPLDDPHASAWQGMSAPHRSLTFSLEAHSKADVRAISTLWSERHWQVEAQTPAGILQFKLHLVGLHNVNNALAAATCSLAAGVPLANIAEGLARFQAVLGRSRLSELKLGGKELLLVDDSYNANPDSVRAAIDALSALPGPHLLVLGDMGEVGSQGAQFHREIGEYAVQSGIENFVAFGKSSLHAIDRFNELTVGRNQAAKHHVSLEDLTVGVKAEIPAVRSVLIKGSRFMQMERVVRALEQLASTSVEAACS